MSESMVERVARAIHEAVAAENWYSWDELSDEDVSVEDPGRNTRRAQARAAIAELRDMIDEALRAPPP